MGFHQLIKGLGKMTATVVRSHRPSAAVLGFVGLFGSMGCAPEGHVIVAQPQVSLPGEWALCQTEQVGGSADMHLLVELAQDATSQDLETHVRTYGSSASIRATMRRAGFYVVRLSAGSSGVDAAADFVRSAGDVVKHAEQYGVVCSSEEGGPGTFVGRVYFEDEGELELLAEYDLDEYRDAEERYVLAYMNESVFWELTDRGWFVRVDEPRTIDWVRSTTPQPEISGALLSGDDYYTVPAMYADLQAFASTYPGLTQLVDYGDSFKKTQLSTTGYDLRALRITNEAISGVKPIVSLVANYHGNEIPGPEIAMRFVRWLLDGYGVDADATWLVDWHEIWVIPTINPDNHRKARTNANGVDLNRNHSFKWVAAPDHGAFPSSEPEVYSVEALLASRLIDQRGPSDTDVALDTTSGVHMSLHTYGRKLMWPWTWTKAFGAPNSAQLSSLGKQMASYNGYTAGQLSTTLYVVAGGDTDWVYGNYGVPAYLFELGTSHAPPYATIDLELWPSNKGAIIHAAKTARAPYQQGQGPMATIASRAYSGDNVAVHAALNDTYSGGQGIVAAQGFVDVPPWKAGAAPIAMIASDGVWGGVNENARLTVSLSELTSGKHIVFVRGKDAAGYWGPVSATFVFTSPGLPPTLNPSPASSQVALLTGQSKLFDPGAVDPDGDDLQYLWTINGAVAGTDPTLLYAAAQDGAGVYDIRVEITDGVHDTLTRSWTLTVSFPAGTFVVDNLDTALITKTGTWRVASAPNPWRGQSLYALLAATFAWRPVLPEAGAYEVYAWWTYATGRASNVPYTVNHSAGSAQVIVDQHDPALGGRWNLLGTYNFAAGNAGYVQVSAENGQTCADAVKLVKVGGTTNQAPHIDAPAAALPNPVSVSGTTTVTVAASDPDGGPLALSYTWSKVTGPGAVSFSVNGTTASHTSVATFAAAGAYTLRVTVSDGQATAASDVNVDVIADVQLSAIIVDDLDTSHVAKVGTWDVSSAFSPWAGQSVFTNNASDTFTWRPVLAEAGTYEVYAWWTYHVNRSTTVPYAVAHAGGSTTVLVNQRDSALASQWVQLGTFDFVAGTTGNVRVSGANGQACADAVKLVKVGGATNQAPHIDAPASAMPNPVNVSGSTTLTVAASDADAGPLALSYTWSKVTGPGAVTFSVNGTTTSHTSVATFSAEGLYVLRVTVSDGQAAVSADVDVDVMPEAQPTAIIVDNLDTSHVTKVGTWSVSTAVNPWAGQSVFTNNASDTFTWRPVLAEAGTYEVYAWWTYHVNRSTTVPYAVAHAGGSTEVLVNQRDSTSASQWVLLGTFDFVAGNIGNVRVSGANGQACADAVKLVKLP